MSFDYFYGQQSDLFTFYRVPKVLFTNERFWNISADAKMLYGILLDRMSLSAKNGWIDKNGRVYIIFTIDEAKMALNCAEQKAIKLLSELEKKAGLIERKRQGLGKPNLIYVKNFISAVDSQLLNCENHNSGTMEITTQELPKSQCNNTDIKNTEFIPEYKIEASTEAPFAVKCEELIGWFLVPKLGEKMSWGMYDIPSRKCIYVYDMQVTGKAKVHGIEGVELTAREASYSDKNEVINRTFVAQLTDTHCRYLATFRNDGDVRNYITFLDGDEFLPNWGFGENNCGNETNLAPKGDIRRAGTVVTSTNKDFLLDIVGRYTVTLGGKSYDTVCVMNIETYNCGVVSEQFLDKNGKTILWRRFNRDDWAIDRYKKLWSEQLPENDRITVNNTTYVHWDDCISDYIL